MFIALNIKKTESSQMRKLVIHLKNLEMQVQTKLSKNK